MSRMDSENTVGCLEKCDYVEEKKPRGHTFWQWFITISVNLNLVTYGMQVGWISPSIKTFQSESSPVGYVMSDGEVSWVGSVLGLAASVAVLPYSFCADKYGRKVCIYAVTAPQAVGWIIKLFATNTVSLIIARVCCGLASGGCFVVIPMYVKEIAQDDIRGLLGSLLIMFQNIGVLAIYGLGACLDYHTVLWAVSWLPILSMVLMLKAPESPTYLMKTGRVEELSATIAFLRGLDEKDDRVHSEVESFKKEYEYLKSLPTVSVISIFKNKAWRRSLLLIMGIFTVHASCGSFAIVSYASSILDSFGGSLDPGLTSLTFPLLMICTAFASMSCVERFGRKMVLGISIVLLISSMTAMAVVVQLQGQGVIAPIWVPLVAITTNVSAYAFGLCPVPYIMLSEMFNFMIRAKVIGMTITFAWLLCFIQLLIFTPLCQALGMHGAFYFFAAINCLGLIITIFYLPETKGKSAEQIEIEMRGNEL